MFVTKKVKKVEEYEEEVVEKAVCDRCGKVLEMVDPPYLLNYKGGHFRPTFPYPSRFDDSKYERETIVMCDDCWECFYESFIFDRIKHCEESESE